MNQWDDFLILYHFCLLLKITLFILQSRGVVGALLIQALGITLCALCWGMCFRLDYAKVCVACMAQGSTD